MYCNRLNQCWLPDLVTTYTHPSLANSTSQTHLCQLLHDSYQVGLGLGLAAWKPIYWSQSAPVGGAYLPSPVNDPHVGECKPWFPLPVFGYVLTVSHHFLPRSFLTDQPFMDLSKLVLDMNSDPTIRTRLFPTDFTAVTRFQVIDELKSFPSQVSWKHHP